MTYFTIRKDIYMTCNLGGSFSFIGVYPIEKERDIHPAPSEYFRFGGWPAYAGFSPVFLRIILTLLFRFDGVRGVD